MNRRIIHLHPDAPTKPLSGQACNGCGVCCAAEPCPIGMLVSLRRRGACSALLWDEGDARYRCSLLQGTGPAEGLGNRLGARLVARWIAAGDGCDSLLEPSTASEPRQGC